MAFRRGFKAEANGIVADVRHELGLSEVERLDPRLLAASLEIPVVDMSEFVRAAPSIAHFQSIEPDVFSAVTVFRGRSRMIVHNDSHHPHRQNSNLCHELAHGLLQHPPTPALDGRGCRDWNQDIEDEAAWLGAALLIPEAMTLEIAKKTYTQTEVVTLFNVSEEMIRFRLNATGAYTRVARAQAYYRR